MVWRLANSNGVVCAFSRRDTTVIDMGQDEVYSTVRSVLAGLTKAEVEIGPQTNVLTELGLTSLTLVDLTLALEDALRLEEFPLQDWIDRENERGEEGFRVASIVETCRQVAG